MEKTFINVDISVQMEMDKKEFNDTVYLLGGEERFMKMISSLVHADLTDKFLNSENVEAHSSKLLYVTAYVSEEATTIG